MGEERDSHSPPRSGICSAISHCVTFVTESGLPFCHCCLGGIYFCFSQSFIGQGLISMQLFWIFWVLVPLELKWRYISEPARTGSSFFWSTATIQWLTLKQHSCIVLYNASKPYVCAVIHSQRHEFTQYLKGSRMTEKHIFFNANSQFKIPKPYVSIIFVSVALKNLNEAAKCSLSENYT